MQKAFHTDHHWCVLSPQDLVDELENATLARDLPGMADVDFSLLAFCREIKSSVTVALSGECADEIFGGYPWYRDPDVRNRDGFPWAQNTAYRTSLLNPLLQEKIPAEEIVREQYERTCRESDILPDNSPEERRMKEMVNLNFRWFMQTLLDRKDRMSMYCSLEVRVPFCDYRIAEYLYSVPWMYKDLGGQEKGLLRKAEEDLLPQSVLYRRKSPFPKTYDPGYEKLVAQQLKNLLQQKEAPVFSFMSRDNILRYLDSDTPWPWYGQLMRRPQVMAWLLQLNFWLQYYKIEMML
jgi:asparagine synthase (glutamine-hydrolysing)